MQYKHKPNKNNNDGINKGKIYRDKKNNKPILGTNPLCNPEFAQFNYCRPRNYV